MTSSGGLAASQNRSTRRRRVASPWVGVVLVAIFAVGVLAPRLIQGLEAGEVDVARAVRSFRHGGSDGRSPELTAAGYVVADRQSVLAAKFTGRLAKLNVSEADFVKKGESSRNSTMTNSTPPLLRPRRKRPKPRRRYSV